MLFLNLFIEFKPQGLIPISVASSTVHTLPEPSHILFCLHFAMGRPSQPISFYNKRIGIPNFINAVIGRRDHN